MPFTKYIAILDTQQNIYMNRYEIFKMLSPFVVSFLAAMRERYQKNGAPLELPTNMKKHLGVVEPSHWTMAKLKVIQNKLGYHWACGMNGDEMDAQYKRITYMCHLHYSSTAAYHIAALLACC